MSVGGMTDDVIAPSGTCLLKWDVSRVVVSRGAGHGCRRLPSLWVFPVVFYISKRVISRCPEDKEREQRLRKRETQVRPDDVDP